MLDAFINGTNTTGSEFIKAYKTEGSIAHAGGIGMVVSFITSATQESAPNNTPKHKGR